MHYLILKQPISCVESKPGPSNHKLFGLGSLGLSVTKKGTLTVSRNRVQDLNFLKEKVVGEGGLSKQSD